MKSRGASAFVAIALTSTSLAHASPLIIDQQRVDQTQAAQPDTLRGLTDEQEASPRIVPQPQRASLPQHGAATAELHSVRISGSSLPPASLDAIWRSRIGTSLDDAAIAAISDGLIADYQHSDIALYSIVTPEQDLASGDLLVQVSEGHIANIVIQTDDANAADIRLARAYAQRLTEERPLRRSTLERMMSFIRDIPGERVEASLAPASEAGGAQLTLTMRRKTFDAGVSVSNRGTPLLGRTQGSLDVSLNGMLRGGDRTDLALTAPIGQHSFRYVALGYTTPVGSDGATVSANISNLHTQPSGVEGEATAGGVSVSYPLLRGFTRTFTVSAGIDALDSENATVGQVVDSSRTRAVRAGLSYADTSATSARNASLFASFGIDGLGARVNPLFADADFTKLALQGGWSQVIAQRFALRLSAQAQLSESDLPASEQFALGGDQYGRAFPSAIIQGDEGLAGSLEVAFLPPDAWLPQIMRGSEAYVFVDAGSVHANARPLLDANDDALSSGGLGARISLAHRLMLGAEVAHAIEAPRGYDDDEWRFVYTLVGRN